VLPIILQAPAVKIGLAGEGEGRERRRAALTEAGVEPIDVGIGGSGLGNIEFLYIAGLTRAASETLVAAAKSRGILVNVEDLPELCDFHAPATVRRGDLLVTISTGGRAPGLAKLIREWISAKLGSEWRSHLDAIAERRADVQRHGRAQSEEKPAPAQASK